MVDIEYIKFRFMLITPVITSVTGFLILYHKFIINQIEKKVDQKLHDKELEYMKTQIRYNYTNLKDKIDGLSDDVKIIKECIVNKI
ncbi:MAG: hypothetical protein ACRC4T_28090 [Cetobacterium sp.]